MKTTVRLSTRFYTIPTMLMLVQNSLSLFSCKCWNSQKAYLGHHCSWGQLRGWSVPQPGSCLCSRMSEAHCASDSVSPQPCCVLCCHHHQSRHHRQHLEPELRRLGQQTAHVLTLAHTHQLGTDSHCSPSAANTENDCMEQLIAQALGGWCRHALSCCKLTMLMLGRG